MAWPIVKAKCFINCRLLMLLDSPFLSRDFCWDVQDGRTGSWLTGNEDGSAGDPYVHGLTHLRFIYLGTVSAKPWPTYQNVHGGGIPWKNRFNWYPFWPKLVSCIGTKLYQFYYKASAARSDTLCTDNGKSFVPMLNFGKNGHLHSIRVLPDLSEILKIYIYIF